MRNYSRKLRKNYKGGLFEGTPQEELEKAKKNVEEANTQLVKAQAKVDAGPAAEGESITDKLKNMSPFKGGGSRMLQRQLKKANKSVKSGVKSVTSGVKYMIPKNPFKSKKQRR